MKIFRYSTVGRENCLLCDRPVNLLDYYVDIEPDRNYDIYSMSDEHNSCSQQIPPHSGGGGGSGGSSTALSDPRNNARKKNLIFVLMGEKINHIFKFLIQSRMLL